MSWRISHEKNIHPHSRIVLHPPIFCLSLARDLRAWILRVTRISYEFLTSRDPRYYFPLAKRDCGLSLICIQNIPWRIHGMSLRSSGRILARPSNFSARFLGDNWRFEWTWARGEWEIAREIGYRTQITRSWGRKIDVRVMTFIRGKRRFFSSASYRMNCSRAVRGRYTDRTPPIMLLFHMNRKFGIVDRLIGYFIT